MKGAQAMRKTEKITALYERLSRDDFYKCNLHPMLVVEIFGTFYNV